ncbi:hypothetical protein AOE01nite_19570 [Acetobacter oeni]|uniref:Uncharacterized protein n=1 Tax=Acetobacter oeni TaxID=304077 RepID=A0A511XLA2_9PROT|nr:hypothetical protein AA21952_0975 [Acetobacter oeni LMG 21952]GEN63733.1 hypothetical protein AOE01nite_19570 [Acetobacter oeni]
MPVTTTFSDSEDLASIPRIAAAFETTEAFVDRTVVAGTAAAEAGGLVTAVVVAGVLLAGLDFLV